MGRRVASGVERRRPSGRGGGDKRPGCASQGGLQEPRSGGQGRNAPQAPIRSDRGLAGDPAAWRGHQDRRPAGQAGRGERPRPAVLVPPQARRLLEFLQDIGAFPRRRMHVGGRRVGRPHGHRRASREAQGYRGGAQRRDGQHPGDMVRATVPGADHQAQHPDSGQRQAGRVQGAAGAGVAGVRAAGPGASADSRGPVGAGVPADRGANRPQLAADYLAGVAGVAGRRGRAITR